MDAPNHEYEPDAKHFKITINCRVVKTSENFLSS
jgi:hypothetical protein